MQKIQLGMVVLWVGQKCTLKCRDCGNLIPYMDQESYDTEKILKSLYSLLEVADIGYIQIQGGEPFTHPDIDKMITIINKLPVNKLHISTNGTVPITENTVKALKNSPRISIGISDYEATITRREKFIETLTQNNINHSIYSFMYGDGTWFYSGEVNEPRNDDKDYVEKMYQDCGCTVCTTLADGLLYTCGRAKAIRYFNSNIVPSLNSSVNVLENDISKRHENLLEFVKNAVNYKEECRYCRGTYEKIAPGIQITSKQRVE